MDLSNTSCAQKISMQYAVHAQTSNARQKGTQKREKTMILRSLACLQGAGVYGTVGRRIYEAVNDRA